jgi:predicted aldo/keto reductase-like oxidoreductase
MNPNSSTPSDNNQSNQSSFTRRDFIRTGAAGATGIALAGLGTRTAQAQDAVPKIPVRTYGRTGLQIGAIVGAGDWSLDVIPLAVQSGVNYWHKAQLWQSIPPALQSQPRESYHLECVVDRVGGSFKTGHLDAEQHYQFVKQSAQRLGVGYFDVFKFHVGYHSVQEAKTDMGMVNAYNRLKKEGLVKYLALSQHHYKEIGGDMAWEVLTYLIESGSPYDACQFFYSYGERKEFDDLLTLAKKNNIATLAMKTMGGVGRSLKEQNVKAMLAEPRFAGSTPGAAMVKWLMSNPNLTAATICTKSFPQLEENVGAASKFVMNEGDREAVKLLAAYNKGLTCLLCSDCVSSCPEHIAIADIFRYERYAMDYDELHRARNEYKALTKDGTSCIACGDCLPACKADINIIAKLKDVHNLLG